jgi:hypothetical protein
MVTLEGLYNARLKTPHNIDQHLPIIREYASRCSHVTEFGTDRGWSTSALLASGCPVVHSYDINRCPEVSTMEELAVRAGVEYVFHLEDTRQVGVIEFTDLLLVDTDHTYEQVKTELRRHAGRVRRYLVFHDTVTFPEINKAIEEECYPNRWNVVEDIRTQHGLLILERVAS